AHGVRELPEFNSGHLLQDLIAFLEHDRKRPDEATARKLMPHFMAYAARNPDFGAAWKRQALEPPRRRLRQILHRAIKRGELPRDLDLEVAIAQLLGAMMYRMALAASENTLEKDLPRRVATAFCTAYSTAKRDRRAGERPRLQQTKA